VIPLKKSVEEKLNEILSHYGGRKDELIPILNRVQEEFGYLRADAMQRIAKFLRITDSTVFGVATFYALFRFFPGGKTGVKVCRGTACHVRGAPRILDEVEKQLGIKPGETTVDLKYSLETIACFGSCALAPVMVVSNKVYGRMTPAKTREVLGDTKQQTGK